MKILGYISRKGRLTTGDEFKVLFFICNTLSLNKASEIEIDRATLAKLCGWWDEDKPKYSLNKVSKITGSLVDKGLLKKRLMFNNEILERKTLYSIPTSDDEKLVKSKPQIIENFGQKSVASNSMYKTVNRINKPVKELNELNGPKETVKDCFVDLDFLN